MLIRYLAGQKPLVLLMLAWFSSFAQAATIYQGQPVAAVLDEFRSRGMPFVYTTNLLPNTVLVLRQPRSMRPLEQAKELLAPHGLTVVSAEDLLLVVRSPEANDEAASASLVVVVRQIADAGPIPASITGLSPELPPPESLGPGIFHFSDLARGQYEILISAPGFVDKKSTVDLEAARTEVVSVNLGKQPLGLDRLVVSSSQYEFYRERATTPFAINQRAIQSMPDFGEDPIRTVQRLPSVAAGGLSARMHFRGGEQDEVGIYLDGHRLLDPFHIRDYHSIFSAVDVRAVDEMEIYTGSYPAEYGNFMSGLILVDSARPAKQRHHEIGLSVFNSSLLSSGFTSDGKGEWLLSARRGNLDVVLNKDLGEPKYYDGFLKGRYEFSPTFSLSAHALISDDAVVVITESEIEELERSDSNTSNSQFWVTLENQWTPNLASSTVISASFFDNQRSATIDDEEKIVASVRDHRDIELFGLRQDWFLTKWEQHQLQFGFELEDVSGRFNYAGEAEYFEFFEAFENQPDTQRRSATATPNGGRYGLYLTDRWQTGPRTSLDLGLRWDRQSYKSASSGSQLSPRLGLLHRLSEHTDFRLSWGRYFQSQLVEELQIEDGVEAYAPAQRSEHWVVGVQHRFQDGTSLRLEAFHKDMDRLKPRYENLFDPHALIPELQPDRVRVDPTDARATGIELSIGRQSHSGLQWWAAYSHMKVTDRIQGRSVRRSWDQRNALQAGIAWSDNRWDLALAASYRTGWPTTSLTLLPGAPALDALGDEYDEDDDDDDESPGFVATPDARNARSLGSFVSIDLRVNRRFRLGDTTLSAFLEISNALDRRNPCCVDYDFEDEDAGARLDQSSDYWLPVLPAIGLLWEF